MAIEIDAIEAEKEKINKNWNEHFSATINENEVEMDIFSHLSKILRMHLFWFDSLHF